MGIGEFIIHHQSIISEECLAAEAKLKRLLPPFAFNREPRPPLRELAPMKDRQ